MPPVWASRLYSLVRGWAYARLHGYADNLCRADRPLPISGAGLAPLKYASVERYSSTRMALAFNRPHCLSALPCPSWRVERCSARVLRPGGKWHTRE